MAPLSRALALLECGVTYALAGAVRATPRAWSRPTPCSECDLAMLLDHVSESIAVFQEALATRRVGSHHGTGHIGAGRDPVERLRAEAATLLGACVAARRPEYVVAVGDRGLAASMVAMTGAIEITIHGWDIWVACGGDRPVPPALAAGLLPIASMLVAPQTRPGLFADPVELSGPATPGDQLVAFLGRRPCPAAPGLGGA